MSTTRNDEFDALVRSVVEDLQDRVRRVDTDGLVEVAHQAVAEAREEQPHLHPEHDAAYLRWVILQAIEELASVEPPLPEVDADHPALDDAAVRSTDLDHIRRLVGGMPDSTAEVVRLVYGLDDTQPLEPVDAADILDLDPDIVRGHVRIAERLFRHYSDDGRDRRLVPLDEHEFQTFLAAGDLAWYDLRDLNLNNADLRSANLAQAVLSGLNLWGVKLTGAKASGVNLWGSQLDGAEMADVDLRLACLERASLCGADLARADLSGANLWKADLTSAAADHANLAGADLRAAQLQGVDLTRADLSGVDLRGADLRNAKLVGADLSGANLQEANLGGTDLRWVDFAGADLCWVDLSVADLRGASLQGAIRSPGLDSLMAKRAPRPERLRPLPRSA